MARILIADDEEDVAIIVRERLENCGHSVAWASDGGAAWAMFEKNHYDLVILDLRMPVLDGYAVCERIKASSRGNIPVMYLSAYIQEKKFTDKNRPDAFLSKPFHAEALIDTVQGLLHRSAEADAAQHLQDPPKD